MPAPRSYTIALFGIVFAIVSTIALVNLRVNPLRVTPSPLSNPEYEPYRDYSRNLRTGKCGYIRSDWPAGVALVGSSRVQNALDPDHPGWGREDVLNFGVSAGFFYESAAFCEYILDHQTPDLIVLGIDLGDLSSEVDTRPLLDFYASPLAPASGRIDRELQYLFGVATMNASLETMENRREEKRPEYSLKGKRLSDDGVRSEGQLAFLAAQFHSAPVQGMGAFGDGVMEGGLMPDKAILLEAIMRECRSRGVRLVCLLHPTHALVYAEREADGEPLIPFVGERKAIVEQAAAANALPLQGPEVEVWDFYGFHPINCEPLPLGDKTRMRWWNDFSHYTDEVGGMILSRIMGWPLEDPIAADYGMKLDPHNFAGWIARLESELKAYLAGSAPRDLAWKRSVTEAPPAP